MRLTRFAVCRLITIAFLMIEEPVVSLKAADDDSKNIRIEKVFGPETQTGRYKHPATITELQSGDLYLAYYGGQGEYAVETSVFGARLAKGASAGRNQ